jgi:hypothetical protein
MPTSILGEFLLCDVSASKKSIKCSIDSNNNYLLSRELFLNSKSQVEWFSLFLDVSLYSDHAQSVIVPPQVVCSNIVFPKKIIPSVFAHKLFPCQTRATARSEFYKWKSSVLGEDIPARPIKGRVWVHVARGKCVSGAQRAPCNAYQRSGYIVTPRERCMLHQYCL